MRLVLLGPPGSGKGTQGQRLASRLGVVHIATGDLLREQVESGTELGRTVAGFLDSGQLVPDQLVLDWALPQLRKAAAAGGYVLDGFPRSVAQAIAVDDLAQRDPIAVDVVVSLEVARAELLRRLLARAAEEGRSDDTHEVIENRLQVFAEETSPLARYYREQAKLLLVDADRDADEVTESILSALAERGQRPG